MMRDLSPELRKVDVSAEPGERPLSGDDRREARVRLEGLLRHLPADRELASSPESYVESSEAIEAEDRKIYQQAAGDLGVGLDEYLLAGFAGLLSRIAWQETISIARLSQGSSLVTFVWEGGGSFRTGLVGMRREEISSAFVTSYAEIGYQFVMMDTETFDISNVGLRLTIQDKGDELVAMLGSSTGKWSKPMLSSWLGLLRTLLRAAAQTPDLPLKQLRMHESSPIPAVYRGLNSTSAEFPSELCAHDLIIRQARQTPNSVAIVFGSKSLTYRELDEMSSQRALQLVALGACPDRPVAVCMERSVYLPVALLAVLKSGSCYVPLDPQHPQQRISSILEECRPVAVLSSTSIAPSLAVDGVAVICMDEPCPETQGANLTASTVAPANLAYIIYTSGTTGHPKGVMISHRALVNLLSTIARRPGLQAADKMLAVATISFDIATMDMFLPLTVGATLIIADRYAAGDPFLLADLIDRHDVTVLQATPFTWKLLVASGWNGKANLKMIAGGEALPRDLANDLVSLGGELWNCYGPTETAIYSGVLRIKAEHGIVPIGSPVDNTIFYVMDENGRPLPAGVPGELFIGGVGVSRGYLDRPELTSQRFVPDTVSDGTGKMLFRTGDLVRIISERELEFLGRLDHQVKLRGYRIELGEVESVLRQHLAVADAAVIMREDVPGEARLVAYLTLRQPDLPLDAKDIREYAARLLPEYMLPARIVALERLPLTGSGKVDRRALPLPETVERATDETNSAIAGVQPADELESQLLRILRDVLGEESLGVTDSFFDHGGYSLLSARLFSRIHRVLGLKLPISLLFDAPTARSLAQIIRDGERLPIVVPIRTKGKAAPLFVIHSYLLYSALPQAIEQDRPIYGIRELDDGRPISSLEQRAAIYAREIVHVCPRGPISLAGWCAAGSLTVEVARQLREAGHVVALLALFDSERPGFKPTVGNGKSLWMARLSSSYKFHAERLRGSSWSGKIRYIFRQPVRWWENILEVFSIRHRDAFLWVQEHCAFLLPEALRNDPAGLTPEELLPTGQQQLYPGKIVLFRASDVPRISGVESSLGWIDVAQGGVDVEFAPGDHESMFRNPHLPLFGKMLERALRDSEARCVGSPV